MRYLSIQSLPASRGEPVQIGNIYHNPHRGKCSHFMVIGIQERVTKGVDDEDVYDKVPFNNVYSVRFNISGEIIGVTADSEQYVRYHRTLVGRGAIEPFRVLCPNSDAVTRSRALAQGRALLEERRKELLK